MAYKSSKNVNSSITVSRHGIWMCQCSQIGKEREREKSSPLKTSKLQSFYTLFYCDSVGGLPVEWSLNGWRRNINRHGLKHHISLKHQLWLSWGPLFGPVWVWAIDMHAAICGSNTPSFTGTQWEDSLLASWVISIPWTARHYNTHTHTQSQMASTGDGWLLFDNRCGTTLCMVLGKPSLIVPTWDPNRHLGRMHLFFTCTYTGDTVGKRLDTSLECKGHISNTLRRYGNLLAQEWGLFLEPIYVHLRESPAHPPYVVYWFPLHCPPASWMPINTASSPLGLAHSSLTPFLPVTLNEFAVILQPQPSHNESTCRASDFTSAPWAIAYWFC